MAAPPAKNEQGSGGGVMQAPELTLLAVPNVMGVAVLLMVLYRLGESYGAGVSLFWSVAAVASVIFVVRNVGEATTGRMVDGRSVTWSPVPRCRVAFVGLDAVGSRMAGLLHSHSRLKVAVFDPRDATRAAEHRKAYSTAACESAAECVEDCRFVFCRLNSAEDVREVVDKISSSNLGKLDDGVAENSPGKDMQNANVTVVDCSLEVTPEAARALAEELAKRGIRYVDASMAGKIEDMREANVAFAVGAPNKDVFEEVKVILQILGKKVVLAGDVGSGRALKAVSDVMSAGNLLLATEGLLALAKNGVDPTVALDALNSSSARSVATYELVPEHVLSRQFNRGTSLEQMEKNCAIVRDILCGSMKQGILSQAVDLIEETRDKLGRDVDFTACAKLLEDRVGLELKAQNKY